MSQTTKVPPTTQKDASERYLEALIHSETLVKAQPPQEDKSAWRRWARSLLNYEVKTLAPCEKRAPRLAKYSNGAGERFLAVMKVIEATETRINNGDGGPSSSGESEPDESLTRRSGRRAAGTKVVTAQAAGAEKRSDSGDSPTAVASAPNLTDAQRTVNYEVPCARCARAGIACAGKEGRACFTCRAHRQGCEFSSRGTLEKVRAGPPDRENEEKESASTTIGSRPTKTQAKSKSERKEDAENDGAETESTAGTHGSRPRRAATLINNWRIGSPKTVAQLRVGSSSSASILRKRRATDADLSVTSSAPPGPSPLKKAKASKRRDGETPQEEEDFDREEVRDALLVCEAAFRQLRKALRV